MLLSFMNKDPISAAQQSGMNNSFVDSPVHNVQAAANSNTKLDRVPARQCILPAIDKLQPRVNLIEQKCSRPLTANEKEQLKEIDQLLRPDGISSPLINAEHIKLLSMFLAIVLLREGIWNGRLQFLSWSTPLKT